MRKNLMLVILCTLLLIGCTDSDSSSKSSTKEKNTSAVAAASSSAVTNDTSSTEAKEVNEYFERAEKYFQASEFEKAIEEYKKVTVDDNEYVTAQQRITEANHKYMESQIKEAEKLSSSNDFSSAIDLLENALIKFENADEVKNALNETKTKYKDYVVEEANRLFLEDNYEEAIGFISVNNKRALDFEEVKTKLNEITEKYISIVISNADKAVKDKNYDDAIDIIEEAKLVVDSETLENKIAEINDIKPVPLSSFTISEEQRFYQVLPDSDFVTDVVGNSYSTANLFLLHSNGETPIWYGYAKVCANKEYSSLSGILAIDERTNNKGNYIFEIYGDDELLYYKNFQKASQPIEIKVDITKVEWVKFQLREQPSNDFTSYDCYTLLSDVLFQK